MGEISCIFSMQEFEVTYLNTKAYQCEFGAITLDRDNDYFADTNNRCERAIEYKMDNQIYRYTRYSKKLRDTVEKQTGLTGYLYGLNCSIAYDVNKKSIVGREIKVIYKILDKAYNICFPDEYNLNCKDIRDTIDKFKNDIKVKNKQIHEYNINLKKQYIVEQNKRIESLNGMFGTNFGLKVDWIFDDPIDNYTSMVKVDINYDTIYNIVGHTRKTITYICKDRVTNDIIGITLAVCIGPDESNIKIVVSQMNYVNNTMYGTNIPILKSIKEYEIYDLRDTPTQYINIVTSILYHCGINVDDVQLFGYKYARQFIYLYENSSIKYLEDILFTDT